MFSSVSSSLLWRGFLAVGIGVVSVAWPHITVGAFVIVFAIYAFVAAGSDAARAFSSDHAGPVAISVIASVAGRGALSQAQRHFVYDRDRLRGWACEIRTQKCRRKLSL